jgi:hypothetical protein
MGNKIVHRTLALSALALVLCMSWMQAAAQGPVNAYPSGAVYLDNQWKYIPPNLSLWYLFDYSGDRSMIELILVNGTLNRLAFNVYTPDQISLPDQTTNPIGRGSTPQVNCDSAKCPANDLVWKGNFTGPGTFYVQVINNNSDSKPFLMQIIGSGVTLRQPTATFTAARPAPTATPDAFQTAVAAVVATLQATRTPQVTSSPVVTTAATPDAMQTIVAAAVATLQTSSMPPPTATPTSAPQPSASSNVTQTIVAAAVATLQSPVAAQPAAPPNVNQAIVAAVVATLQAPIPPPAAAPIFVPAPAVPPPISVGPAPAPQPNNFWPQNAIYVEDSRWRFIPGHSDLWFRFDYAGDRSQVTIRLPDGYKNHLEFRIYTEDQVKRFERDGEYVGESSAPMIPCDTGKCPSNELFWSGGFAERGIFYIQVSNFESVGKPFQLVVSGTGVVLGH